MHNENLTSDSLQNCSLNIYKSLTRFYCANRLDQKSAPGCWRMFMRKFLFVLLTDICCLGLPYSLSAQEKGNDKFSTIYDPFIVVTSTISLKSAQNQTDALILQIQNESLNSILLDRPSAMHLRLPGIDTSSWILNLKRSDILASNSRLVMGTDRGDQELPIRFISYFGTVEGKDKSRVSISYSDAGIRANIMMGEKAYELSPVENNSDYSSGRYLLGRRSETGPERFFTCGDELFSLPKLIYPSLNTNSSNKSQSNDTLAVKIAIESDYETYAFFGNDADRATTYLLSLFAAVSQIYEQEAGVKLKVSYLRVWATPDDPYSSDIYQWPLMSEFIDYWNNNMQGVDRNIAHLVTKRIAAGASSMSGGLGMIAGDFCKKNVYSFTNECTEGEYDVSSTAVYIAAHELGHNFHSEHTHNCVWPAGPNGTIGPIDRCSVNCTGETDFTTLGTIMSYCPNTEMVFHQLTRNLIRAVSEGSPCVGSGITQAYSVSGRVTIGGVGLKGASIKASDFSSVLNVSTTTDTNGYYTLQLPGNVYDFDCRLNNYAIQGPDGPNHGEAAVVANITGFDFRAIDAFADSFEPDDSPGQAKQIATQGDIQYRTIHNDINADYIKFTAIAGEVLSIKSLPAENGYSTTLSLLSIKLLDSDGTTQLAYAFQNPHFVWTAPKTGTYYLEVQGPVGPYGISVSNALFIASDQQLAGLNWSSAAWGDYDNDNDLDLIISGGILNPRTLIYRNDNGNFIDINAPFPNMHGTVEWGDYDNDGDLDILITGTLQISPGNNQGATKIFRNDHGTFVDINASFPKIFAASAKWGDYDNDGALDILFTGRLESDGSLVAYICVNDSGNFVPVNIDIKSVWGGTVIWGDYDTDGDLDIMITGSTGSSTTDNPASRIYRNDGGVFTDIQAAIADVAFNSSAAWGDYDNDGDLDLAVTGYSLNQDVSKIYRNDNGSFNDIGVGLYGIHNSAVAWGDCNNDGNLDFIEAGDTAVYSLPMPATYLYLNKEGTFINCHESIADITLGVLAWGDYDNDGDLDLLLSGRNKNLIDTTILYKNLSQIHNDSPVSATGLAAAVSKNSVTFSWNKSTDDYTPEDGLTYNIRVGTAPGKGDVLSPMSNLITGYRLIPAFGNVWHNKKWTLNNLSSGTYYWSVQAIDNSFAGSMWATEQSFTVNNTVGSGTSTVDSRLFTIFPNPTNGIVNIEFTKGSGIRTEIMLMNTLGAEIFRKEIRNVIKFRIDLSNQISGVYLLKITNNNQQYISKIVILKE